MYHDVSVGFTLDSATYKDNKCWEIRIKLSSGIFGGPYNHSEMVGTNYVEDRKGELTPSKAFELAVQQILKGDKNWRPILSHDTD